MIETFDLTQSRLLVVGEDEATESALVEVFNNHGFHSVLWLEDARHLAQKVSAFDPDLLLIHLSSHDLPAFDFLQRLDSSRGEEAGLPVIFLARKVDPLSRRSAVAAGAADFLEISPDCLELMSRAGNLLRERFYQKEARHQRHLLEQKVAAQDEELAKMRSELRELQNRILDQEGVRSFSKMIEGVVHDFNNSLMSVVGYSSLLIEQSAIRESAETLRRYLGYIHEAGREASNAVERLPSFYKRGSGHACRESINFNKIVENATRFTEPKWKSQALENGQSIQVDLALEKLPAMRGMATELHDLIANLIFNATDAMPFGGTVTLKTTPGVGGLEFSITDTGIGMFAETRARCLELFNGKEAPSPGSGYSRICEILLRHQGRIEIESELEKGTTVRLFLPYSENSVEDASPAPPPHHRPLSILVVDDEEHSREIVSQYLAGDGHAVVSVAGHEKAISHCREVHFDVVITDQAMPGMAGTSLGSILKQMRKGQPILLVTGFAKSAAPVEGQVDMVLSKPVSRGDLRRALVCLASAS